MTTADTGRFHLTGGCKVRRAEADAVHARRGQRDLLDVFHAFSCFQNRVNADRLFNAVLGFECASSWSTK